MKPKNKAKGAVTKSDVIKIIKSYNKPELKYKDFDNTNIGVDSVGAIYHVSGISQGTTALTRTGDQVSLKSLEFRLLLNVNSTDVSNVFRVIIFQWFDVATPSVASLIQNTGTPLTSQITHDYSQEKNLIILWDAPFKVNINGVANELIFKKINLNRGITFQQGSSSQGSGTIYYYICSDSSAAPNPVHYWESRLYFTDE